MKEFLDNCSFGVIVRDNISHNVNDEFNPNIFLATGYLLARGKRHRGRNDAAGNVAALV